MLFNHTFTPDKPIYFPAYWESGKSGQQVYEEWKQAWDYKLMSNVLQALGAAMWIFVLGVLVISLKELWRYL
jgi:hypothetical protein